MAHGPTCRNIRIFFGTSCLPGGRSALEIRTSSFPPVPPWPCPSSWSASSSGSASSTWRPDAGQRSRAQRKPRLPDRRHLSSNGTRQPAGAVPGIAGASCDLRDRGASPLPFDRMMEAVAALRPSSSSSSTARASRHPGWPERHEFLSFGEVVEAMEAADVVVSHAGVGSIICALRAGHTPVVLPRLERYSETVDDHQLELCRALEAQRRVVVVWNSDRITETVAAAPARRRPEPETEPADSSSAAAGPSWARSGRRRDCLNRPGSAGAARRDATCLRGVARKRSEFCAPHREAEHATTEYPSREPAERRVQALAPHPGPRPVRTRRGKPSPRARRPATANLE